LEWHSHRSEFPLSHTWERGTGGEGVQRISVP
jgi:hypothetical protein